MTDPQIFLSLGGLVLVFFGLLAAVGLALIPLSLFLGVLVVRRLLRWQEDRLRHLARVAREGWEDRPPACGQENHTFPCPPPPSVTGNRGRSAAPAAADSSTARPPPRAGP